MRFAITTLGCKINQFESQAMSEILEKEGFRLVRFEEPADIYVINTCTVTARTDAESRRLIRRARRRNHEAKIVVTGCYAQIAPGEVGGIEGVDLVLGNAEKKDIAALVRSIDESLRIRVSDISSGSERERLRVETHEEHTRAFLRIQNGCDSFCSYCIVPHARGRSRSVETAEVLDGVRRLVERGFREVVLTGIHLGAYGADHVPAASLLALLERLEEEKPVRRLRLGSIEPLEMTAELIRFLIVSDIVCPHLHIPLQSGSASVLERMNRRYEPALFRDLSLQLHASIPGLCLGSDIIAGFPGETETEFTETMELLESLPLAYLHVFPFSSRPGTPAAQMPGHLPNAIVTARAAALRELSEGKRRLFHEGFIGRKLQVLVQRGREEGGTGLSANYIPVTISGDCRAGDVITVGIHAATAAGCSGSPLPTEDVETAVEKV